MGAQMQLSAKPRVPQILTLGSWENRPGSCEGVPHCSSVGFAKLTMRASSNSSAEQIPDRGETLCVVRSVHAL